MTTFSASTTGRPGEVVSIATGKFTSDGTTITINSGFSPRWIRVVNTTDVIIWEWNEGLAATNTIKTVTAGTTTIDTGSAIVVPVDPGHATAAGSNTFTISSTAAGTAKAISWIAVA